MASFYLGFDLSTQQLKAIVVESDLKFVQEAKVDFDADLLKYGIEKGVLTNPAEGEVFAPPAMWLEALDLVLLRLQEGGVDFSKIKGVSGAGMQHGTVFWSHEAEELLENLNPSQTLVEQLEGGAKGERKGAFAHPFSPNWQDASTQKQCEAFDKMLGSPEKLAEATGSKAHHRFSGPQIMRFREKHSEHYKATARISLVSSFIASVLLGKIAPIDIGDVGGMNLRDIRQGQWNEKLLALTAGGDSGVPDLKSKLGEIPESGALSFGPISKYFVTRFGFPSDCAVIPCTGDNPSTILALPLQASDAMVSLGTSTTFLMSTPEWKPDPAYHFMNHPCTAGLYMFMLCYKNGGLARENIRDTLNPSNTKSSASWDAFDAAVLGTPPLGQKTPKAGAARLGLFFPRPEIVPNVKAGTWRYLYDPNSKALKPIDRDDEDWGGPRSDARAIVESQMLSLRLRSHNLSHPQKSSSGAKLPPQPRRVYLVGGGSNNNAIAEVAAQVLGGAEGVYKLDIGGNACALGSAYKAAWGVNRARDEAFEKFVGDRWREEDFVKKVAEGYREGVFEHYGEVVQAFADLEAKVIEAAGEGK